MIRIDNSEDAVVQQALVDGELHKKLLDDLDTGIYIVDRERRILYWNGGAERITGYLAQEVTGQYCQGDLLLDCDAAGGDLCGVNLPLQNVIADGKRRDSIVYLRHRQGHRIPVRVRLSPVHDKDGNIVGAVEAFDEASASARHVIQQLEAFGCLDELTGAANRAYGEMRARHAIEALNEFRIPFGWLRISLDEAERLEQLFGHGVIDAALKTVAGTLDCNPGPRDVLTRWGNTEFRVEVHYSARVELAELAESLVTLVRSSTLDWWGDQRRVTVSIAGATAEHGDSLGSLEARAGRSMESCQAGGGDRAAVTGAAGERPSPCFQ